MVHEDNHSHLWLLGVRDGDREYLKVGAVAALYYLSLERVAARGSERADLGWSRAFLNDGPLRYKRKLAQRITETSERTIVIKPVSFTPATRSFLRNNPFISETAEGLCGVIFRDSETPLTEEEVSQLTGTTFIPASPKFLFTLFPQREYRRNV